MSTLWGETMNDRIKQLAGQALDKVVPHTWTTLGYEDVWKLQDKLAHLMIEEIERYIEQSEGDVQYIQYLIDKNLKG